MDRSERDVGYELKLDKVSLIRPAIVRMASNSLACFNPLKEIKKSAAERWVDAVNADRVHGRWRYCMVSKASEIDTAINEAVTEFSRSL